MIYTKILSSTVVFNTDYKNRFLNSKSAY